MTERPGKLQKNSKIIERNGLIQKRWRAICVLLCSLIGLSCCSYLFIKEKIPDHILMEAGTELPRLLRFPYNAIIEEQVLEEGSKEVSNAAPSDIPQENLTLSDGTETEKKEDSFQRQYERTVDSHLTIECSLFGCIPLKEVEVEEVQRQKLYAGGSPVGIYIQTEGVLVIGTGSVNGADGQSYQPAEHIVKSGDYIIEANGQQMTSKEELVECIQNSQGQEIQLEILREGVRTMQTVTPIRTDTEEYKAGIWVRNDAQGVGTLTYVDQQGKFGALGHGISDVDTSTLLSLKEGKLYEAEVIAVKKGQSGTPGELTGVIHYRENAVLGQITSNTAAGIYGTIRKKQWIENAEEYEIAYKQEVKNGPAQILCSVDGEEKMYEIQIERIDLNKKEQNKGMVLQVTDEELLEKTGGIVQGMSGSPIIQDGKIVGAVTHVCVNL